MKTNANKNNMFSTGGTVRRNSLYIERKADQELYENIRNGKFCYLLAARQMGKSSMLHSLKQKLEQDNYRIIYFDLNQIVQSYSEEEIWYTSIFQLIAYKLGDKMAFNKLWRENTGLSYQARFTLYLEDILLPRTKDNIVIMIDEIDGVLKAKENNIQTDDFFAVIRSIHNSKDINPGYDKINFIIAGVAEPIDLISDVDRTPFNIGERIPLENFSRQEVQKFIPALGSRPEDAEEILETVFFWTNGQPFLTQILCNKIVKDNIPLGDIDKLITEFINEKGASIGNSKTHFDTIESRIHRGRGNKVQMLAYYQMLRNGERISYKSKEYEMRYMILSGLVIVRHGFIEVNNRMYFKVFDDEWLEKSWDTLASDFNKQLRVWLENGKCDKYLLSAKHATKANERAQHDTTLSPTEREFIHKSDARNVMHHRRTKQRNSLILVFVSAFLVGTIILALSYRKQSVKITRKNDSLHVKNTHINKLNDSITLSNQAKDSASRELKISLAAKEQLNTRLKMANEAKKKQQAQLRIKNKKIEAVNNMLKVVSRARALASEDPTQAMLLLQRLFENDPAARDYGFIVQAARDIYKAHEFYHVQYSGIQQFAKGIGKTALLLDQTPKAILVDSTLYEEHSYSLDAPSNILASPLYEAIVTRTINIDSMEVVDVISDSVISQIPGSFLKYSHESGRYYSYNLNGKFWVYDKHFRKQWQLGLNLIQGPENVTLTPDGKGIILTDGQGTILHYRKNSTHYQHRKVTQAKHIKALAVAPGGETLVATGENKKLYIYSTKDYKLLASPDLFTEAQSIAYAPNSLSLAIGGAEGDIYLYDIHGHMLDRYQSQLGRINYVDFIRKGKMIMSLSEQGKFALWPVRQRPQIQVPDSLMLAFSPAARCYATRENNNIRFYGFDNKPQDSISLPQQPITKASFAMQGRYFLFSSLNKMFVYDLKRDILHKKAYYSEQIRDYAISEGSRRILVLLSGNQNFWSYNFDLGEKRSYYLPLGPENQPIGQITALCLDRNGKHLYIGNSAGNVFQMDTLPRDTVVAGKFAVRQVLAPYQDSLWISSMENKKVSVWHGAAHRYDLKGLDAPVRYIGIMHRTQSIVALTKRNSLLLWDKNGELYYRKKFTDLQPGHMLLTPGAIWVYDTDGILLKIIPKPPYYQEFRQREYVLM